MRIAFGADHAGFEMKEYLRDTLKGRGIEVLDIGTHYPTPADYPDYAVQVAELVGKGEAGSQAFLARELHGSASLGG